MGVGLAIAWAVLLVIWLVRLPVEQLYKPTLSLLGWLSARVLLRLSVGVFGGLWWESLQAPEAPPFSVVILQAGCPQAWERAEAALKAFRGMRVGLIVAKPREAYWAIPPTEDTTVWATLWRAMRAAQPPQTRSAAIAPVLAQLRPYQTQLIQALWIGDFDSLPAALARSQWLPACAASPREELPFLTNLSTFRPTSPSLSMAQVYSLLVLGSGFALLALEVVLYVFRYNLPFRLVQEPIR